MVSFAKKATGAGILFFALVCFWPALKKDHSGPARVIDAGAIELNGERHRLYGIHALALAETCRRRDGSDWPCGQEAAAALSRFLQGRTLACEPHGRDAGGQFSSICYVESDNINAWLVRAGWAMADRAAPRMLNFAREEDMARFPGVGRWSSKFPAPK
ncbi:thermonuclease family protein [Methylocystis sp. JAN1]|jgi:endonuclease YncB( thermonuclease family)|uniref:thermonuclease family protein n=1 Tax=Methylocystis sp. JAN1 TaxID=3397211 RepID=UPI003FA1D8C8